MENTKNAYFDSFLSKKILEYTYKDPIYTISQIQNYMEEYPNDYSMMTNYISLLINMNRIEESAILLKELEENFVTNKKINNYSEKREIFYKKFIYTKLRLLFHKKEYSKWLNLYRKNNIPIDRKKEVHLCSLCAKKELGLLNIEKPENRYLVGQIVEYNFEDFKKHIKHHMSNYEELVEDDYSEEEIKERSIFNEDFPLDKILDELLKLIPNENKMNGFYENQYIFKYDNSGRSHNKIADYFKVVTFANTDELITMYPTFYGEKLPYTDLNYLKEEQPKIKTISRIDKFNRKYNMV